MIVRLALDVLMTVTGYGLQQLKCPQARSQMLKKQILKIKQKSNSGVTELAKETERCICRRTDGSLRFKQIEGFKVQGSILRIFHLFSTYVVLLKLRNIPCSYQFSYLN